MPYLDVAMKTFMSSTYRKKTGVSAIMKYQVMMAFTSTAAAQLMVKLKNPLIVAPSLCGIKRKYINFGLVLTF